MFTISRNSLYWGSLYRGLSVHSLSSYFENCVLPKFDRAAKTRNSIKNIISFKLWIYLIHWLQLYGRHYCWFLLNSKYFWKIQVENYNLNPQLCTKLQHFWHLFQLEYLQTTKTIQNVWVHYISLRNKVNLFWDHGIRDILHYENVPIRTFPNELL